MKCFYNDESKSFAVYSNFESKTSEKEIEVNPNDYIEYQDKIKNGYEVHINVEGNKVIFNYTRPKNYLENQKKERLRNKRATLLTAFDKWEKAVLRGREEDSVSIMTWYQDLKDLKETAFENIPNRIAYYLKLKGGN